jgi:phosphoribosyl-AMP cyclohydrolase / phosphoribosyl-ATP pyrophosphohydrolase
MDFSAIKFDDKGLVPVVVQSDSGREVLMQAFADREALEATERTGFAHFHSRSRGKLWMKGETSGNRLAIQSIRLDCDGDSILYLCRPEGPTCHTGAVSCYFRTIHGVDPEPGPDLLDEIEAVLRGRMREAAPPSADIRVGGGTASNPGADEGSYTAKLLKGDASKIRKKIGEEAFEVVLASEREDKKNLADEVADLWFHSLLLLVKHDLGVRDVMASLKDRRGKRRSATGETIVVAPASALRKA